MILVFGGAYQGKLDYVLDRFSLTENDVYKCTFDCADLPQNKRVIYELDKWLYALIIKDKSDSEIYAELEKITQNYDVIIICNDISCGVVPVKEADRKWREVTGRVLSRITKNSDEVIRLFCGIPTRIL